MSFCNRKMRCNRGMAAPSGGGESRRAGIHRQFPIPRRCGAATEGRTWEVKALSYGFVYDSCEACCPNVKPGGSGGAQDARRLWGKVSCGGRGASYMLELSEVHLATTLVPTA